MTRLVDDRQLGALLRGEGSAEGGGPIFTTGCWYVRLCQAVLGAEERTGVLSAPFMGLPAELRERAVRSVIDLPDEIGVLSLRTLGPLMGHLRGRHALNLLGLEALAAAVHLDAEVHLSGPVPRLEAALQNEGRVVCMEPA